MTCWAIIPVKAPHLGKSRLATVLDASARSALVHAMLHHVFAAASAASNIERVCLVGGSRLGLPDEVPLLADPGGGLNHILRSALTSALQGGATRLVVIAADLPTVTSQELELMAVAPAGTVALAPDRHGVGTNAISLPLPEARDFAFAFGPDSFALHNAEAERRGLKVEVIHSQGLARDIDEPADLPDATELLGPAGGSAA